MATNVTVGLLARIEALPGKEVEVEAFLTQGAAMAGDEPGTARWFALRLGPSTFGVFDAFPDDAGRQAHLSGAIAQALLESVGTLISEPTIEPVDVIAEMPPR